MDTLHCSHGSFKLVVRESTSFLNSRRSSAINFSSPIHTNHSKTPTTPLTVLSGTRSSVDSKQAVIHFPETISPPFAPTTHIHEEEVHSWSALEIANAVGGEIVRWGPSGTICTDTRKLKHGQWFFAIAGENFDGHRFVNQELADKGCAGVVGNRVCKNWERGFIRVEGDTRNALEKMAEYNRNRFRGVVVGVTGSAGKTTTRTMISLALRSLGCVYQTHGNLNYMVGVALTLIGIPLGADAVVVELGMGGKKGEIRKMAGLSCPSVRVILNVGHCHMEHLGSLEEVAQAKGELLMDAKPGDICVLNADDPLVMGMPIPFGVRKVLFGRRLDSDVRLVLAESVDGGCAVRVILQTQMYRHGDAFPFSVAKTSEMIDFKIRGPGLHLAVDACAAAAVAFSLGIPLSSIGKALSRFRPVSMRSEMQLSNNGIRIINDTYNASLTSMIAAITSLKSIDCSGKRVAILGDMLELGPVEAEAHEKVLDLCCDDSLGVVMLCGERFFAAAERLNLSRNINFRYTRDMESLMPKIADILAFGDVALVKGSRAMQMEKIVEEIRSINLWDRARY